MNDTNERSCVSRGSVGILADARKWLADFADNRDEQRTHYEGCHTSWTHSTCLGRRMADEIERLCGVAASVAWIPCGERQPDYEVPVLAWADGYSLVAMLRCDEHGDFWDSFQEGDEIDPACITQWMPLPAPPTELGSDAGK